MRSKTACSNGQVEQIALWRFDGPRRVLDRVGEFRQFEIVDDGHAMRDGKRNVLFLGSGAREHALARACANSPLIDNLFVAPGNPGCEAVARTFPLNLSDHPRVAAICRKESIDLVVVGPEAPLLARLADDLATDAMSCFGPSPSPARLDGAKGFAQHFCREVGIPTGDYRRFRDPHESKAHIRERGAPIVVKADGLAAGKGVIVAKTIAEAEAGVDGLASRAFGSPGDELGIEEG